MSGNGAWEDAVNREFIGFVETTVALVADDEMLPDEAFFEIRDRMEVL